MSETRKVTLIWLALILATAIGALISTFEETGVLVVFFTVTILIIKGQLIVDYFMNLKDVAKHWRMLMSAYCIVIGAFVFSAYCLSIFFQ